MRRGYSLVEVMLCVALLMVLLGGLLPLAGQTAGHHTDAARYTEDLQRAAWVADRLAAAVRAAVGVRAQTPDGRWVTGAETLVLELPDGELEVWSFQPARPSQPPLPGRLTRVRTRADGGLLREDLGWSCGLVLRYDARRPAEVRGVTVEVELQRALYDARPQALSTRALVGAGEGLR